MNHDDIKNQLFSYYDGEVSAEEKAAIDRHLPLCPECCSVISEWKLISQRLFVSSSKPNNDQFVENVMLKIKQQKPHFSSRFQWFWTWPRLVPLTALAMVFLGLFVFRSPDQTISVSLEDPQSSANMTSYDVISSAWEESASAGDNDGADDIGTRLEAVFL